MLIIAFTWLTNIPSHIFPRHLNILPAPHICQFCCPYPAKPSRAYSATLTALPCQIWDKTYGHPNQGMGIKNGKVSWQVGAWGLQKAPSGGPGGNASGGGQGAKPPEAF